MANSKVVYVLEKGQMTKNGYYQFYETIILSSKRKLEQYIENCYKINKGFDMIIEDGYSTNKNDVKLYSYNCMSSENDPNLSIVMSIRYKTYKQEII